MDFVRVDSFNELVEEFLLEEVIGPPNRPAVVEHDQNVRTLIVLLTIMNKRAGWIRRHCSA